MLTALPVGTVRRLPPATRDDLRHRLFSLFGTPQGHPLIQLPRKPLLTNPDDTAVQVGTPNVDRVRLYDQLAAETIIFEPDPRNRRRLETVATGYDTVSIDGRAVTNTHGTVAFELSEETGGGKIRSDGGANSINVKAVPLDSLQVDPDFVEIMINGSELEALKGATGLLEEVGPRLLIKAYGLGVSPDHRTDEIIGLLRGFGYRVTQSPIRSTVPSTGSPDGDIFASKL